MKLKEQCINSTVYIALAVHTNNALITQDISKYKYNLSVYIQFNVVMEKEYYKHSTKDKQENNHFIACGESLKSKMCHLCHLLY